MKKVLSLQFRLWKLPLYIIPFMQEYMRKGLSAPSLESCEQSQAAKFVIWPSAWICTYHPSSLSLPFIFYQQYFLNCSNSLLWQTDIFQQPNQSWDFPLQFPKSHLSLCLFLKQGERFIPIFICFSHVILCQYFSLLSFWSCYNLRLTLSLHTFTVRYLLVSMRSLPPFWILLRLNPFFKILSDYFSQLLLWASLIYDLFFPVDH